MTDYSNFKVAKAFQHLDPTAWQANDISSGFTSIRIRGKQWSLQHGGKNYPFKRDDDGTPLSYIDLIVLAVNPVKSRVYFEDWKAEDSASGPICASLDGIKPDPGVSIPQAKTCAVCEHSQWITKPGGGRGQECQEHKRVAILLMPSMTKKMLGAPLLEPVYFKVPPASLTSWKRYTDEMIHQGIPLAAAVTRVSFNPDHLFQMNFEMIQTLSDAEAPRVLPMMESAQTKMIIGGIAPARLAAPVQEREKVDTGLLEAFGAPPAAANGKKRGRPAKAAPVIDAEAEDITVATTPAAAPEAQSEEPPAGAPEVWQESDDDIDDTITKLMSNKMNNMLK
jgi:hypothetical protein